MRHFDKLQNSRRGRKKDATPSAAPYFSTVSHQRAQAPAVHVRHASKINRDLPRAFVKQLFEPLPKLLLTFAHHQRAIEIENRRRARFANSDYHVNLVNRTLFELAALGKQSLIPSRGALPREMPSPLLRVNRYVLMDAC